MTDCAVLAAYAAQLDEEPPEREHIASVDCWCRPTVQAYGDQSDEPGHGEGE